MLVVRDTVRQSGQSYEMDSEHYEEVTRVSRPEREDEHLDKGMKPAQLSNDYENCSPTEGSALI